MSRISALLALLLCLCMTVSLAESDSLIAEELIKADSVNYDAAALESGLYERTFSASADEYFPHTYTIRYTGGGARFGEYLVTRGDEVKEGDRLAVLLQEGDEVALAEAKLELQRANEAMESETDSRREQIADMEQALLDVQEGRVDATLAEPPVAANVISTQGLNVDYVLREEATPVPTFWLYSQTDAYADSNKELAAAVDVALQTLIDDGTLAAIGEEYLGGDYSTEEALLARLGGAN